MATIETDRPAILGLFPPGTGLDTDGELLLGGCRASDLAAEFGTPAFVVDEAALRNRARGVRAGLEARWPDAQVLFASKSFPCTAIYRVMAQEGLSVDVAGGGELVMALAAGFSGERIYLHGNAKTEEELRLALDAGVGTVIVDNHDDLDRLERMVRGEQRVLVRVIPGVDAATHQAMATGGADSKFGLPLPEARRAIERIRASDRLRLDGVHVHVGSQILDTEPLARAVEVVASLGEFDVYDLGGGLGVRYTYVDRAPAVEEYLDALIGAARRGLPASARVLIEPGRSLVAEATVTLYRVVTVKRGAPTFVAVDGGMGDNLEVSLYGTRFEATLASRVGGGDPVELVGRHCESGDLISSAVPLRDPQVGDLVAVPVTGAYCPTMVNNYNGARRPPVVFCRDGAARLVLRRERYEELLGRDVRD